MTGWIEPEKLAIEHVRNCGEWMPVTRVRLGKGAHHSRDRQPTINRGIRVDVEIVIVIDKVAPDCRTENDAAEGKNSECQQPSVDAGVMTKPDVRFRHARYFSGRNLVVAARFHVEERSRAAGWAPRQRGSGHGYYFPAEFRSFRTTQGLLTARLKSNYSWLCLTRPGAPKSRPWPPRPPFASFWGVRSRTSFFFGSGFLGSLI